MLSFVQSWFAAGANPIGVDFGTECLRMAQVEKTGGECRLVAAASIAVPPAIRDAAARLEFFSTNLRELWAKGNFRGRQVVLALPAASMYVQHLRLPRMDDESIKKALPWESQGKLPIDPANALLRHLVAGDIYFDREPRSEVIVLAAQRDLVDGLLAAAAKARLDVVAMNIEPAALLDCFLHIYRRQNDAQLTNCFVDIGSRASRAIIARGQQILFVRNLPIGGRHFSDAVAGAPNIPPEEAAALRSQSPARLNIASPGAAACLDPLPYHGRPARVFDSIGKTRGFSADLVQDSAETAVIPMGWRQSGGTAVLEATADVEPRHPALDRTRIDDAVREPLAKLIEQLSHCRRYHESTFPDLPIERLIFVGGEANQRAVCQQVARELGIAAQVGDPLVRMRRTTELGIENGIDRRQPQPAWAVAIGLSMGPLESNAT